MCCIGFLKVMMFIFNGGIFLAGAALLGVGIWIKVDMDSLLGLLGDMGESGSQMTNTLASASYMLIGVGVVLFVIGFLGCCGAVKESRCMLLTFFSIVLILFIVEIAGAVILLVFRDVADDIFEKVADDVRDTIKNNYGHNEPFTLQWNKTMELFQCCGYTNYTDFTGSSFTTDFGTYPDVCCNGVNGTTGPCFFETARKAAVDGCFDRLLEFIEGNSVTIAAVALGVLALEFAAMVVSMILYNNIGRKA